MRIDAERLRGFLDCMHDEADERDKRSAQIAAIVKAAKEVGFDTKAVRKVFVRERMDEAERAKQDDLLETYEGALGPKGRALAAIASGAPVGETARANGVHRATLARARHVAKQPSNATVANEAPNATPAHDPDTGEITENREADSSAVDAGRRSPPSTPAAEFVAVNPDPPLGGVALSGHSGQGEHPGTHSNDAGADAPAAGSCRVPPPGATPRPSGEAGIAGGSKQDQSVDLNPKAPPNPLPVSDEEAFRLMEESHARFTSLCRDRVPA